MEFFNKVHCKYIDIDGFINIYNDAIRYQYMITQKADHKVKVLIFWEKHGIGYATKVVLKCEQSLCNY